ncbi:MULTISPECIES: serine hydrolase domain-containing protein [unclassified Pseudomonas]|uniref:serine hydrolase domain-containing protein n=1 Tax=unclassified Pseudomonas TaxID=196821 RepID=UPI002AC99185|nr:MULTISPECIES: serine hydrolase domain-containing protein [unclassified Pseudomonas]MEB0039261.1 serine hydrolase domain-containing protein [Pseudomonas sp. MH10]MEB0076088.1 serine hydrolase domain-containing protein [Pseudomonas sp. MH10out]MEB0090805.1 serine hydrolase domain-containing protein [Pseudomonas sp. CCI4.2]MEB0100111.1 serine hydrolase domain-containing protein [Pseudomonas sp. CCI3.2]MEB0119700.1 serine hydrolase domain-containing protein [Pseudomonas sp. CCI1.2]
MIIPESVGLSSERLARIDAFIQKEYIDTGKLPCASTQIWRHGQLAYSSVLGSADKERGLPLKADSLFRIYSMTKPITSIAFMMLVEEGKVSLDDPVARYIPSWANLGVFQAGVTGAFQTRKPTQAMQVIDLLRHTSGLTYGFQQRSNVDAAYRHLKLDGVNSEGGLEAFVTALASVPLEFDPGEAWNYSVSTDVLGYLVQVISGMPFETFLRERVFQPLNMVDTDFSVRTGQEHRLTACYALDQHGNVVLQDDPATSAFLSDPATKSGGGGLVSTADDYMRFSRMLLNGGELDGVRIVSPKTLKLMTMNHLPGGKELGEMSDSPFSESLVDGLGFGLGFAVTINQARTLNMGSLGEFFWGGMASTGFWIDPVEDIAVVFMTQLMPSSAYPIRQKLRTLVYSALTESDA